MSAYVRTSSVTALNDAGGVKVILSFYNSANTQLTSYASAPVTGTNDWERIMISGAVPSGTSYARAYISLQNATGSAWFDCAQFEEGDGANLYNLLQNSSFTDGITGWSGSNLNTAYDKVYSESGKMTYRLLGGAEVHKNIYQTVYINRPAKESALNVSGKVKADSVSINGERQCSLLVKYTFTDATVESKLVKFNPDTSGDQFVNQAVYPGEANKEKTVSHVTFYALYYDNMNSAFFNDLQLTLDETGTTYTYDDKGNMISAVDNGQRNENYSYNNASELTSATNPDNTNYTYKYADNNEHRLIAARSTNSKIEFAFSYDANGNVTKTESYYTDTSGNKVGRHNYTEEIYTSDGNYVSKSTDDRGNQTNYTYNTTKGTLEQSIDAKGNVIQYSYYDNNDCIKSVKAVDKNNTSDVLAQNVYTYGTKNGQLSTITSGIADSSVGYEFLYDEFGNRTGAKVGNQELIFHTYENNNGNLESSVYGNGNTVSYMYDSYDRVTEIKYNNENSARYIYSYDAENNLSKAIDNESNKTYTYVYDILGRLTSVNGSDGTRISYVFDKYNKSTKTNYKINGQKRTIEYIYNENKDNALSQTKFPNSSIFQISYDDYGRVATKTVQKGTLSWTNSIDYTNVNASRYSNKVSSVYFSQYGENGKRIWYNYDESGNIVRIAESAVSGTSASAETKVTYEYDQLNQLKKEINHYTGETVEYTYDNRGNILSKAITKNGVTDTVNYTYGDSNWKDKLTAYDGNAITYDAIGNPLTYNGWAFSWQKGRELGGMTKTGTSLAFTYNNEGVRTSKTVNGTKTEYYLDGSNIIGQKTGDAMVWFYYDGNGTRTYMEYNNQAYYYVYNAQGDVIALYDNSGTVVAEYTYDSWGEIVSAVENEDIQNLNPFKYRGYYYDVETGLYYLQSRYYNPEIGRFINSDSESVLAAQDYLIGQNLFAYCTNDPVNCCDDDGSWKMSNWTKVLIGAVALTAAVAITVGTGGAAAPLLIGAAVSTISSAASGAAVGYLTGGKDGMKQGLIDGAADGFMWGGLSALGSSISGAVAAGKATKAATGVANQGCGKNACFIAGTAVLTRIGFTAIEEIKAGDWVWSENPETGEKSLKRVVQTFENETSELIHVFVEGEEIEATPTHPFYVLQIGWTDACRLRAGDILVKQNGGYIVVEKVQHELLESPIKVYNLEVESFHTYFVGETSILVHNLCVKQYNTSGTGQVHHPFSRKVVNQANQNPNLKGVVRRDTGTLKTLNQESHKGYQIWHRNLDNQVVDWLGKNKNATVRNFAEFMNQMYSSPDMLSRFGKVKFIP